MAWGLIHYADPLVPATFKTYGRPIYGESPPVILFASGLVLVWFGWLIYSDSIKR